MRAAVEQRARAYRAPLNTPRTRLLRRFPTHWLFLLPMLLLVVVFFFVPVILNLILAFTDMTLSLRWEFVGLKNYVKFLQDPLIPQIAKNTLVYVSATLSINVIFGLFLALLTTYFVKRENVGLAFRSLWLLPRMTPPVVYALLWIWMTDPTEYGLLNMMLQAFGLPPLSWRTEYPMATIILVNGMVGASFGMIIFSAAIKSIPVDYIRAAKVDGASDLGVVRWVILPLLKWPLMFVTTWQTLSLLASYEYILLVTQGGPNHRSEVWSLYAYYKAFASGQYGYGAAIAMVLVAVAVIIALLMLRIFGFRRLMELMR